MAFVVLVFCFSLFIGNKVGVFQNTLYANESTVTYLVEDILTSLGPLVAILKR